MANNHALRQFVQASDHSANSHRGHRAANRHYHYIVLIAPRQQVTLYAAIGEVVRDLISGAAVASRNAEQTLHMFV